MEPTRDYHAEWNPKAVQRRALAAVMRERSEMELSMMEFAGELYLSCHAVTSWESGKRRVGLWSLYQLWVRGPFDAAELAGRIVTEALP